ncbi:transcriptional regulator [Paenibacillus sp. JX-17]|uniref:Transcriptional regulator n=1 Tax=Paenibacillus lacisoli TaxID=3064525 RepID=A0ABT9C9Y1_9BACL|nr:metalloregulator ArsR/SmtB family transcription factor [Paenibacillus sp. JX-17]MDO7906046.1 transcriptional regulator [Paenibacillus sp. JX-17]
MKIQPEMSTRQLLMTLLKTKGPIAVSRLAAELGITEMGVRRHLNQMEKDGYIETTVVRQAMGRPTFLYALTEHGHEQFPRNYSHLLLELLEELDDSQGSQAVHQLFDGRKHKMLDRYGPKMEGRDLSERVAELTSIQHAGGYMAHWEQEKDGSYTLYEYNCPINEVARRYQHACACEQSLFQELLQAEVTRTECLALGGSCCKYRIQPPGPSA